MAHMMALVTTAEAAVERATASAKTSISSPDHCTKTSDGHPPRSYTPADPETTEGNEGRSRKSQVAAGETTMSNGQGSADQDELGAGANGTRRERAASRWSRESDGARRDIAFTLRQRVNSADSDGGWSFAGSVGASGAGGGDIEINQFLPPEGLEVCICRVRVARLNLLEGHPPSTSCLEFA